MRAGRKEAPDDEHTKKCEAVSRGVPEEGGAAGTGQAPGKQRDVLLCRRAAATRRAGPFRRPARKWQRPLQLRRRPGFQVCPERSLAIQAVGSRFHDGPCSQHPERAFQAAIPQELSADCCGSGELSVLSAASPVPESNSRGCRCPTDRTEFRGGAAVNVNSGQEDRSDFPTVVLEPVPGAAAHALEVDDPCGDVGVAAGVAPVDGQLERPAVEVPGVFINRKRLSLAVPDKGQGCLGFQTVGQGIRHEGCQQSTRRCPLEDCRSVVQTSRPSHPPMRLGAPSRRR